MARSDKGHARQKDYKPRTPKMVDSTSDERVVINHPFVGSDRQCDRCFGPREDHMPETIPSTSDERTP